MRKPSSLQASDAERRRDTGFNRRTLLRKGAGLLADFGFFGGRSVPAWALDAEDNFVDVYRSLIIAMGSVPGSPVVASQADAHAQAFARQMAAKRDRERKGLQFILGSVEDGKDRGEFTGRAPRDKAAYLRARLREPGLYRRAVRSNVILNAIDLAAAPFADEVVREPAVVFLTWNGES